MKQIKLNNSADFVLVDDEDFERVSQYKWSIRGDHKGAVGRYTFTHKTKHHTLAQEVMQQPRVMFDHIDRNPLNNQKSNLRVASYAANAYNSTKTLGKFTSQYKGVYWDKIKGKWRARITVQQKLKSLGEFASEVNAGIAYNCAAFKHAGEFASFNPLPFVA
jgi:hypothetical protein